MGKHENGRRHQSGSLQELAAMMIAHLGGLDPEPEPEPVPAPGEGASSTFSGTSMLVDNPETGRMSESRSKSIVDEWVSPDEWARQHAGKAVR